MTISLSPAKASELDPIPAFLVKEVIQVLLGPITKIVNGSVLQGTFPSDLKMSIIVPKLKKRNLDAAELAS